MAERGLRNYRKLPGTNVTGYIKIKSRALLKQKKTASAVFYNNGGEGFAGSSQTARHGSDWLYQDQIPSSPQTKKDRISGLLQ
jgi:hypothetical protein